MKNTLKDHYDSIAAFYELLDWGFERFRYRKLRPIVWSHARGKILDMGVGTGLNIPYYPKGAPMVGVDLSEGMLHRARAQAARLGVPVELRQMDAARLEFSDSSFDTVVSTFLFCVLPNEIQPQALSEARRILVPQGRLILMEYAYSKNPLRKLWMKMMSPWVHWVYRAGFDRRTAEFLREGGWNIITDRFIYQDIIRLVVAQRN